MTIKGQILIGRIGAFSILWAILHVVFSFISWSINPMEWHIIARIVYSILTVLLLKSVVYAKINSKGEIMK